MTLGTALLVVVAGAVTATARYAVGRLAPAWRGPMRWTAIAVVALSTLLAALQLCGWMDALSAGPIVVVTVALSAVVGGAARLVRQSPAATATTRGSQSAAATTTADRIEGGIAAVALAVVGVQWCAHTADAVARGMTHPDTLWYHLPFAARFVQTRSFTGLGGLGYEAARWFPFDSQALHALGIALLHRDALSPVLNLGWAALALVAAAAIGDQIGHRARAVLGAVAALSLPVLAATQPGQASSDIACAALLLAAVALLRGAGMEPVPLALAGLAAGLAIATKVTIAVPFAALVLGVVVVAVFMGARNERPERCSAARRRRWVAAMSWVGAIGATGVWWFVRDWVGTGSPLPWLDIGIGPIHTRAAVDEGGQPLVRSLFDGDAWRDVYLHGLAQGLTRAWPLVLAIVIAAAVAFIICSTRRDGAADDRGIDRVLGVAIVAGLVGHAFTPLTGGFSFVFNLRYLGPVLLIALVLLPIAVGRLAVPALAIVITVSSFTSHHERVAAWPHDRILPAIGAVAAVGAAVVMLRLVRGSWRPVAFAAVAAVAVGSWFAVAHAYEHNRYARGGLNGADATELFRNVHHARVAVLGTDETLPMFGLDLSNRVRRADDPPPRVGDCAGWRRHLVGYAYVVVTRFGFSVYRIPDRAVLEDDPGVRLVGQDRTTSVYAIDALHPERC